MSEKVAVPQRTRNVALMVVDVRGETRKYVLTGKMMLPMPMCEEGQRARFPIPEFKVPPVGMVCDVTSDSVSIVFPFVDALDTQSVDGKTFFASEDIVNLFLKFEPRLTLNKRLSHGI